MSRTEHILYFQPDPKDKKEENDEVVETPDKSATTRPEEPFVFPDSAFDPRG
jgi:hypothetical protein